ncbi:MAG: PAAR domain-containing protein [Burkholderiaceae bacterium]|jgi:uncharacterized Zn-binding protein involved in type VI secretion|nr:PAAR domain-containing protein [Burkholderiaceae bacterium]
MGQPAARISDLHGCPVHVGGPIFTGQPNVLIGGLPAARKTDLALCPESPPDRIAEGEPTVLIGGKPAARIGDNMAHGGVVVTGCPTVFIGHAQQGVCLQQAAQQGRAFVDDSGK